VVGVGTRPVLTGTAEITAAWINENSPPALGDHEAVDGVPGSAWTLDLSCMTISLTSVVSLMSKGSPFPRG
jgi:hypothetical protein